MKTMKISTLLNPFTKRFTLLVLLFTLITAGTFAQPADPANPLSDSPACSVTGVTLTANGAAPAGETWYWQTTATGTSTANSAATNLVTVSGTYYIRSQDNTTLDWSNGAGSVTVVVMPIVGTPVFSLGATTTRCQASATRNLFCNFNQCALYRLHT